MLGVKKSPEIEILKTLTTLRLIIFICAIFFSISSVGQNKIDSLLTQLNKVHRASRIFGNNGVPTIYLNQSDKTLDIGDIFISVENIVCHYEERKNSKTNIHAAVLVCKITNCITSEEDKKSALGFPNSIALFFKTKDACYTFINLLEQIKNQFIRN